MCELSDEAAPFVAMLSAEAPPNVATKDGEEGSIANSALPIITAAVAADSWGANKFFWYFWKLNNYKILKVAI